VVEEIVSTTGPRPTVVASANGWSCSRICFVGDDCLTGLSDGKSPDVTISFDGS